MVAAESVLERVIREAPNIPDPSPFDLRGSQFWEGPWFAIGKKAVLLITDPDEMKPFMQQFADYIQEKYKLSEEKAEKSAIDCIGYCTGYVGDKLANKWFRAVPEISHPIMGRERPFRGGDNVSMYCVMGQSDDDEVKSYLFRRLKEDIDDFGFEVIDGETIVSKDNPSYFAIRLMPKQSGWMKGSMAYIFMKGLVIGLESQIEKDLGKLCKLSLDTISE